MWTPSEFQGHALPKTSGSKYLFEEIRNAVAAGKEVTLHERPNHAFGWRGSGYTVIDPEPQAYMIDGGEWRALILPGLRLIRAGLSFLGFFLDLSLPRFTTRLGDHTEMYVVFCHAANISCNRGV